MNLHTFQNRGEVPSGVVMYLTAEQVDSRRFMLHPAGDDGWFKPKAPPDKRQPFTADRPAFFMAGEQIGLDGEVPPVLASAFVNETPAGAKQKVDLAAELVTAKARHADTTAELDALKATLRKAADGLVTAETASAAAAKAAAALSKDAPPKAVKDAEKAVEDAEKVVGAIEAEIGAFIAGFATPMKKDPGRLVE